MTWDEFFEWLMGWEGKAVANDPRDPGGMTAWGISRRYHPLWAGWGLVDSGEHDKLEPMVRAFYRDTYGALWAALPERVNAVAVDTAVNMGSVYAVQLLQASLNRLAQSEWVVVDGKLGPLTLEAVRIEDRNGLAFAMCAGRMAEYNRRARKDKNKAVFLRGWLNRVSSLMDVI